MEGQPGEKITLTAGKTIVVSNAAANDVIVEVEFMVLIIKSLKHVVPGRGLPSRRTKEGILRAQRQEIAPTVFFTVTGRERSMVRLQQPIRVVLGSR